MSKIKKSTFDTSKSPRKIFDKVDTQQLGGEILKMIMAHFEDHESPDGTAWEDYSEDYKKRLQKAGEDQTPDMTRTGKMRSLMALRAAERKLSVGILGKKGADPGYLAAERRRPFIGLSQKETEELIDLYMSMLVDKWDGLIINIPVEEGSPIAKANLAKVSGAESGIESGSSSSIATDLLAQASSTK